MAPLLRYSSRNDCPGHADEQPGSQDFALAAVAEENKLRERIHRAMLKYINGEAWQMLPEQYLWR